MSVKINFKGLSLIIFQIIVISLLLSGCEKSDNTLAPYVGSPIISNLQIEEESFSPKITWVGGYVSMLGVSKGSKAILDSSLVWLLYKSENGIHYPVQYGELPDGVQDLTSQFGGTTTAELDEDSTYTFWIIKGDVSDIVLANPNKTIILDTLLTEEYDIAGDTIKLSASIYTETTELLDNYINIYEISTFGKLGKISIEKPKTSNNPKITWVINQSDVTDTLIAAIGVALGSQYSSSTSVWEVYSEVEENGVLQYGKNNVIASPVIMGQTIDETKIFVEYPEDGLERGQTYYLWIANKDWDSENRLRSTSYYAYATFKTN